MNKSEKEFFNMFTDIVKSDRESDMFGHYDFIISNKVSFNTSIVLIVSNSVVIVIITFNF